MATDSGLVFTAKVKGEDIRQFHEWADTVSGIIKHEEISSISPMVPHTGKKTKIALARIREGLTQQELADRLGVSVSQEQRWEYGKYGIKTSVLIRIGQALDVDWTTLIDE